MSVERYQYQSAAPARQNGQFPKGFAGRPVGSRNKIQKELAEVIHYTLELCGTPQTRLITKLIKDRRSVNGKVEAKVIRTLIQEISTPTGRDGAYGYMTWLACNRPDLYVQLLIRTLPAQIKADVSASGRVDHAHAHMHLHRLADGSVDLTKLSLDEISAMYREVAQTPPALPVPVEDE
jgi:hypothetical protein